MRSVYVIDYGAGNILSVERALQHLGCQVSTCSRPFNITEPDAVILPGVGSFGYAMQQLRKQSLIENLLDYVASGRQFIGICLGMQLLFDHSEESGGCEGLQIIPGKVVSIPRWNLVGKAIRRPHIGWVNLQKEVECSSSLSIRMSYSESDQFYFTHSYYVVPRDKTVIMAYADYDGIDLTAVIHKEQVFGFQFHPEKSGRVGLNLLRTLLA